MKLKELKEKTNSLKIALFGDRIEIESSKFIKDIIPNYEKFWKVFVLPYREDDSIWLNSELSAEHEALCIFNYSIFRSSLRVYQLWKTAEINYNISSEISTDEFNDWLIWIDSSYDKIKNFCGTCLLNFDTVEAKEKYKIKENIYNYGSLFVKFKDYNDDIFNKINNEMKDISLLRNYVLHNLKFPGYKNLIPKNEFLHELARWSDFRKYIEENKDKPIEQLEKLTDRYILLKKTSEKLFDIVNELWGTIVDNELKLHGDNPAMDFDKINSKIKNNTNNISDSLLKSYKDKDFYPYNYTIPSGLWSPSIETAESGSTPGNKVV